MDKAGCPFAAAARNDPKSVSMCPFASKLTAAPETAPEQAPAVCPLGFGTARGPKLTTLHCPVCKGLLFDAHKVTSCQHTFCRSCISQTRDCPSCGRDVDGLEPNPELAGMVDTFLDTHSQSPELVAAQADLGPLPDYTAASFFLAQGLKSLAGGNIHAAMHRLGKAKQALLDSTLAPPTPSGMAAAAAAAGGADDTSAVSAPSAAGDSASAGLTAGSTSQDAGTAAAAAAAAAESADADEADSMDLDPDGSMQQQQHSRLLQEKQGGSAGTALSRAVQMATVCGCLGDCYQRLGQPDQAEQQYKESVAAVQPHAEESSEAAHAMSVSLNKLGDARYLSQQLPAAKALYKQALQLRQLCCGPLTHGQAGPQEQLELAASLVKLADVCKAMGEADEGEQHLHRAHGVCCEVQAMDTGDGLPPLVSRKLQMLLGVLQAQGQHWGSQTAAGTGGAAAAAAGDS